MTDFFFIPSRRESPITRINPSGTKVYVARWTDRTGKRRIGWRPDIRGTYPLRRLAQAAIDACYERERRTPTNPRTVGEYAATWTERRPRARVTNRTNECRLRAVLDVRIEGLPLRDWPLYQLRRRHAVQLTAHLLTEQRRARTGVINIIGTLSAMTEDAIEDDVLLANPFKGVKVRTNDPRIEKAPRRIRVWSWAQMYEFAQACASADTGGPQLNAWRRVHAEPMVRVLADCGLRAGELLALYSTDLNVKDGTLSIAWTVSLGEMLSGTKNDHGEMDAGRVVPVPGALMDQLQLLLSTRPAALVPADDDRSKRLRPDALLFPSPRGKLWGYANWWVQVWKPGREASGLDIRPHEMRHSYITLLRAAGVNDADLAAIAGHRVETMLSRYAHSLGRSFDHVRGAVGRGEPTRIGPREGGGDSARRLLGGPGLA